jgi:hypothetical protein
MPSDATNRATRKEWRELGFFYECDDVAKAWKLTGSRSGLLQFCEILREYAANSSNDYESEHEHYGPHYLEIMTWHEAGIDEHAIRGPLPDLKRLATIIGTQLAGAQPGATIRIHSEFEGNSPWALVLIVREEGFDPSDADPTLPREGDS